MGKSKSIFQGALRVKLRKLVFEPAFSLEIKQKNNKTKTYQVKVFNHCSVDVSWKQYEVNICRISFMKANYYFIKPSNVYWAFFNYNIKIYTDNFVRLSTQFLLDYWGIKEDAELLRVRIIPQILDYLFSELFFLVKPDSKLADWWGSFMFQVDFKPDEFHEERKPQIAKVKLLDNDVIEIGTIKPDKTRIDNLIYEIYKASVFTIDLPVAYSLVHFWIDVMRIVFEEIKNVFMKGIELVE